MPPSSDIPDPERAWRESFDAFERLVGRPLEEFMNSEEFADAAARYVKAHADTQAELRKGSDAWLRMWKLAGSDDIEALRAELRAATTRLDTLEARLGAA